MRQRARSATAKNDAKRGPATRGAGARPAPEGPPRRPPLFPIALRLDGRTCVVVGGGIIAARKAGDLLRAGARVRAVAPAWAESFEPLVAGHGEAIERITRRFAERDLDGALLVFAATDDRAVQRAVARAAAERGVLCNVVDVTDLCAFHVPATLRRGALSVSVATDGEFPLLAVALRDRLARVVGGAFGPALEKLAEARAQVRARHPDDQAARARRLRALLTEEALDRLLEGKDGEFERHLRSWQASLSD